MYPFTQASGTAQVNLLKTYEFNITISVVSVHIHPLFTINIYLHLRGLAFGASRKVSGIPDSQSKHAKPFPGWLLEWIRQTDWLRGCLFVPGVWVEER